MKTKKDKKTKLQEEVKKYSEILEDDTSVENIEEWLKKHEQMFDKLNEKLLHVEKTKSWNWFFMIIQTLLTIILIPAILQWTNLISPVPLILYTGYLLLLINIIFLIMVSVNRGKLVSSYKEEFSNSFFVMILLGGVGFTIVSIVGGILFSRELRKTEDKIYEEMLKLNTTYKSSNKPK